MASKESSTSTIGPIEIKTNLKSSFKATCAERQTSMTKEIISFIEGFVKRYRKQSEPAHTEPAEPSAGES